MGGTDADGMIEKMRADTESDWPTRLLARIAKAPVTDEVDIPRHAKWATRPDLNPNELRALTCMSHGLMLAMAAQTLGCSPETIKTQLTSARYKLKAKNTLHACCLALRAGLIT